MTLEERIKSFANLGTLLRRDLDDYSMNANNSLSNIIHKQFKINPWFTPENVSNALRAIADELTLENLTEWTNNYPELRENSEQATVGIIMAGNIPLAGFHDMLSVVISGNKLIAKTSSKDPELPVYIAESLIELNTEFAGIIKFTDGNLSDFDCVIATGSDNSSRYFDYYFAKYPNIIRKNRNSIAVLDGKETSEELRELGKDIFSYFGLGCRNVSKIFLPEGYDISIFTEAWDDFNAVINHSKYANNYDFNKAVYLVNREKFFDTGYLLLKESKGLSSPVSVVHYEFYKSQTAVKQELESLKEKIQCTVSRDDIPYGKAQSPKLWDYADQIDTIEFLLKKKYSRNIVI